MTGTNLRPSPADLTRGSICFAGGWIAGQTLVKPGNDAGFDEAAGRVTGMEHS